MEKEEVKEELIEAKANPYNISVMMEATSLLNENKRVSKTLTESDYTDVYVKLQIQSYDEAISLYENEDLVLLTEPITQKTVIEEPIQDPLPPSDDFVELYTVVKRDYLIPVTSTEVLDELYIPADLDTTLEYVAHYISGNLDEEPTVVSDDENIPGETYLYLPEYDPNGIVNLDNSGARTKWSIRIRIRLPKRSYPKGKVTVKDNTLGTVPVPGVKVRVIHWGRIVSGLTDANGNYKIDAGFWVGTHVHVLFDDNRVLIKPFDTRNAGTAILSVINSMITGSIHMVGWKSKNSLENMNIHLSHDNQARFWCLIKVAVAKYYQYCAQVGISTPPGKLTLYAHWANSYGAASAPMLNYVTGINRTSWIYQGLDDIGLSFTSELVNNVLAVLPDVTIKANSNETVNSDKVIHTIFHELAHTSHYRAAGSSFWAEYIGYVITHNGYGNENSSGNGLVALSESWAEYVADRFSNMYHGQFNYIQYNRIVTNKEEDAFTDKADEWIPYGIYWDMTDNTGVNEPSIFVKNSWRSIVDGVSGFTTSQYYQTLTPSIKSPTAFKTSFISTYGGAQSTQINNLFNSYGY
ncbi:MAG: hypothetical protein O9294_13760 [Cytophagales bacterium]|nr:hypothetical protein [Cytophagales bacterium]